MILEIDYRESKIIELMKDNNSIKYKVLNLPIGDFVIRDFNENIIYIIERKSYADLSASIRDNRFREQKQRLLESMGDASKIIYILENNTTTKFSLSKNILDSAILNLILKHNYKVIYTKNHQDTLDMLLLLFKKIVNNELIESNRTIQQILIKKSDNINDNIFIHILTVIPRVSVSIAQKIVEKYNCISLLMDAYIQLSDINLKKKMLSDIQITDTRKLGKVLSERIYNIFCTE